MATLPIVVVQLLLLKGGWGEKVDGKNMLGAQYYDGKKIVLPISEDASLDLLNHWVHQAAGGIMSAFATNRINKFVLKVFWSLFQHFFILTILSQY